jgi:trehalose-6-phosphate synthase
VRPHASLLTEQTKDGQLIVRVDRTELSKNVVRGLAAYRELLSTRPEWHGRVTHLAFAYPSRSGLAEYHAYTEQVRELAKEINEDFRTPGWALYAGLCMPADGRWRRSGGDTPGLSGNATIVRGKALRFTMTLLI